METATDDVEQDWTPVEGEVRALEHRRIKEETCAKWRYKVGELADGTQAHIMESRDDKGRLVAQKFRTRDTKGLWQGDAKNPPLYGKWLWQAGGKYLTITEGEIDAMSVSQAFDLKFPVVSLPNGTGSLAKVIKRDYEWITSFQNVVLMFDMDEPGQEAVQKACELLPPGKVKVAKLSHKDANEVLLKQGPGALVDAFWKAEVWRPDGIVDGASFLLEDVYEDSAAGFTLPYPELQRMTLGLRKGEITMLTAGSGIGKSTWARELAYHLHQAHGCYIGNVFLEENNKKTVQSYVAIHNNVPLGILRSNRTVLSEDKWKEALESVVHKGMWFYDHFGSLESERLLGKLRYMAQVCKVDFIILDHVSIVTSGIESSSEGERKDIDILMTRLRSLVEETGVGVIAIVHLKRTQGKSFNEGGQISLSDFRGSASLEQLSDNAWALERDQQAGDKKRDVSQVRVLKCRETGDTGEADSLLYDRKTGRLTLASPFDVQEFNPHSDEEATVF